MLKYLIRYKFSILLAAFISLLSLIPSSSLPSSSLFSISFLDKIVHMCMYGAIGLVALLETRCQDLCLKKHGLLLFLLFLAASVVLFIYLNPFLLNPYGETLVRLDICCIRIFCICRLKSVHILLSVFVYD